MRKALIKHDLKRIMREMSDECRYDSISVREDMARYKAVIDENYCVIICCMFHPPSKQEIRCMPNGMKTTAIRMWEEKHKAVEKTESILVTKGIKETAAKDIAQSLGGLKKLHRDMHKEWQISQRTFYRDVTKANNIVGEIIFKSMLKLENAFFKQEEVKKVV